MFTYQNTKSTILFLLIFSFSVAQDADTTVTEEEVGGEEKAIPVLISVIHRIKGTQTFLHCIMDSITPLLATLARLRIQNFFLIFIAMMIS